MKKRNQKVEEAEALKKELATVSTVILSTFQGITVTDDTMLRRAVQAAGGHYRVVKNRIAERAAEGTSAESLLKGMKGTNSISYIQTDAVSLAKVLTRIAKDVPAFKFRAGVVDGRVLSIAEIQQLASLPSKEELIGKIMYLLQAPAQRLASATAGVTRNLAITLQEAIKAEKFSS